jgi:sigma-B regulation protein RsbU (phosphoserine phosphatase)
MVLSAKSAQMAFEKEELSLLQGLLHQAALALETSLLLEERTRQAELERELEIAAAIQASLLPEAVRFAPGFRVAAACRPARHVGGDFIAELPGPGGEHWAVAYGDVSGKSVSGALVMMAAYEVLCSLAMTARDPEELLRLANQRIYRLSKKGFVALGYFTLSADGGGLDYLLAGQPQPILKRATGAVQELPLPASRLPLGGLPEVRYRRLSVPLDPGDLVLGYSDGVVEARSPGGEFFGSERLLEVLAGSPAEPDEVVRRVLAAVDAFTGGHEPYDDLTLVAIHRQPEAA